ncbi:MAG: type II secretion system F family protein [Maricaulaceae bacterium]
MNAESIALFQTALYAVVALLVVGTVYTVLSPFFEGNDLKKRMGSVASTRDDLRRSRMDELNRSDALRSKDGTNFVKNAVEKLSLERLLEASDLRDKLAQAGLRGQRPLYIFYFMRLTLPMGFGFLGLVFLIGLNIGDHTLMQRVSYTIFGVAIGFYLPAIFLKSKATSRLNAIMPHFPDALDLLLICVESGMSVELAFGRVAEEMGDSSAELAEEFSLTTAELSYLQSRQQAFENFARRNNHVGIKSVSTALIQAERYGTPLGETLRTLADENRQMRVLLAEKKAAALPAKLTVPMIIFFLPVLFVVILTPAAMRLGGAL